MSQQTALRRDDKLLQSARRIFGEDLVIAAYVSTYDYGNSTPEEISLRLSNEMFTRVIEKGHLSYDAKTIVLKFINGRVVEFNNSEWASINLLDGCTYEA